MGTESENCVDELLKRSREAEELLQGLKDDSSDDRVERAKVLVKETQLYIDNNKSLIPSFILKQVSDALRKLENHINSSSKSKLTFKFKAKPRESIVAKVAPSTTSQTHQTNDDIIATNTFGFQNRRSENLSLDADECLFKDISLVDLEGCTVSINGLANTVYIRNLKNTTVTICLACRAITVKNCTGCQLNLVCQQLRIDSTTDCEFIIFTSARSMLEASKDLTFKELKLGDSSRLKLSEEKVQQLMAEAKFNPVQNNWQCIDDFDWLSPDLPSKNYICQQV